MTAEEPAKTYRFGIDAGSKTVKVVIVDEDGTVVNSIYRRHLSNIRETLVDILHSESSESCGSYTYLELR